MKKIFLILIVVGAFFMQGLTSCSKSNSELIDEYKTAIKEQIEASGRGDSEAARKAGEKASKISKELEGRKLTSEEKQQVIEAAAEIGETIQTTGIQMMNDAVNQVSEDGMNDNFSDPQETDMDEEE